MATTTSIEWTEVTWNPVTGCTKISAGCKNCYAARMAKRLEAMGVQRYQKGFKLQTHDDLIDLPKSWKKPRVVFVNSMSDLFHKDVSLSFIKKVFKTMNECPQHTFQVLTKRSDRLMTLAPKLNWTSNIWMGVSVENNDVQDRIEDLRCVPATVRFLSCEPLIGPLDSMNLSGIHWVIVGGESGPHSRPMEEAWVQDILKQCKRADTKFFFKQWGGTNKKQTGRKLNKRTYDEMPV
ncbi:phage Gp37/Gp68 family protein [Coraliomargarita sp. SDUM461004]|uniref:Phage Gp37/Gp68 family protein n=1 Tax=Thalassobacterium sedimentorum TaxID=3041258 RepID=A0ABU1AQB6_9BACT|nr:phage Gp37/Gp68 family protein [Coraliomargarita sp. SDUM461004]MDQ8195788.1 phage Gp37/Gp68 family protein [Coraliomargarita sp. SDUM461004]